MLKGEKKKNLRLCKELASCFHRSRWESSVANCMVWSESCSRWDDMV